MQMPSALQKAVLRRASGILLGILVLIWAVVSSWDWMLMIHGLLIAGYSIFSAYSLILQQNSNAIIAIQGTCMDVERTAVRKRIRSVYLRTEGLDIKLTIHHNPPHTLSVGDTVTVYIHERTAVYELDGHQVLCDYLAIEKSRIPENKLAH